MIRFPFRLTVITILTAGCAATSVMPDPTLTSGQRPSTGPGEIRSAPQAGPSQSEVSPINNSATTGGSIRHISAPRKAATSSPATPKPGTEEPAASLPSKFARMLEQNRKDFTIDLDKDGKPEIEMKRLPDGGAAVTLSFPGPKGGASRQYRLDEAGNILRFRRDDDGDGKAEEVLLALSGNRWFRVLKGGNAYYLAEGSRKRGTAAGWFGEDFPPSPDVLLQSIHADANKALSISPKPDVMLRWENGAVVFYNARGRKQLGALLGRRFFPAAALLLPVSAVRAPANRPAETVPRDNIPGNRIPLVDSTALRQISGPLPPSPLPGPERFILIAANERRLSVPGAADRKIRGLPGELLSPPAGRLLCRSTPGEIEGLRKCILYKVPGKGWLGWFDRDGDGKREGKVVRWSPERILEYPENDRMVSEIFFRGELVEKHFRPIGKAAPKVVEYYGEDGLIRRETDTNGDGRFDRFEFPDGKQVRIYFDSDGDGLPDKWLKGEANAGESDPQTR